MSKKLTISSHKGPYQVSFNQSAKIIFSGWTGSSKHILVDANIAKIYANEMCEILKHPNTIILDATEENKSIEKVTLIMTQLVETGAIKRDHELIAIGGGIVQDITCFIASVLLRGLNWKFIPTTLLSQADSCIGSKSSINLGGIKNLIGTFNPPSDVIIQSEFLKSLERKEVLSGIGEIIKVHAINGISSYDKLANDYDRLLLDTNLLAKYVRNALEIKKKYIEQDEFDQNVRNLFNYGHSFGHAIEASTNHAIPHGIAVSMGMDMANRIAELRAILPEKHYRRMHSMLHKNYVDYLNIKIPFEIFFSALLKDKKNVDKNLVLILPEGENSKISKHQVKSDEAFITQCKKFLSEIVE